jgi:ubiquinone/menaquinone biosynthesis C-methylase UbiE
VYALRVAIPPGPHRGFFDLWSRFYDAPLVQRLTYRPEHDAVLRGLRRAAHARVLDVGCGTVLLAARIGHELPKARVVACDFSRGMLARAASHGRVKALVQASALALPFRDASFDAIVTTEAFHWFPDQARALAEFHRLLAPHGRVFVSLVNPPLEAMARLGSRLSRVLGEPAHWPTRAGMRRLLEHAGFEVESQHLVLRVPATLVLPSILTIGARTARGGPRRVARASGGKDRPAPG